MVSGTTLPIPGFFPQELTYVGINQRGTQKYVNVGYIVTAPSGSQIVFQTVFRELQTNMYKGDLHAVNFESKEITSYFKGWGTWTKLYGDGHHSDKSFLETGTLTKQL